MYRPLGHGERKHKKKEDVVEEEEQEEEGHRTQVRPV